MIIPKRFSDKLSGMGAFQAATNLSLSIIENYLQGSPKFFPEYTNHGLKHIERVLEIADKLIPSDTFSTLTERDISILISGTLLHDLGMFIDKDGLKDILFGTRKYNKIDKLDEISWENEWKEYVERIRRYSGRKLKKIYGDAANVKIPSETMADLTDRDILTYGDFLRQKHDRLAHEIAINGFPGKKSTVIFENLEKSIVDLIGLLARSHGIPIRKTSDFVVLFGADNNCPLGVPIYYLMAILRLADYLDAGCDRASHVIDNMQEKISPLSNEEWSWNQAIKYENYEWAYDLELLNIYAIPTSSSQFVKIESWLKAVQSELDLCWAILGEFYRNKYQIAIRRINSNVTKDESRQVFEKRFLAQNVSLSANPDIIKLMIAPLYGNNPSFGIRELIQNAVDACNEREYIEKLRGNHSYKSVVDVNIDEKSKLFTIRDNGIGMNSNVIINYFLVAGSTFRQSDIWKRNFTDPENNSLIRRSGRFGVGFLATYLIGDYVKITTRHMDDDRGYQLSVKLDDDQLDVIRTDAEIGTVIEIEIDDAFIERIKKPVYNSSFSAEWNKWFYFCSPTVNYYIDEKQIDTYLPSIPDEMEKAEEWFAVELPDFKNVQWSYFYKTESNAFCNGIIIERYSHCLYNDREDLEFEIKLPAISFIDYEGMLPINLARNKISYHNSFDFIVRDIYRYILAELLCANVTSTRGDDFSLNTRAIDKERWYGTFAYTIPKDNTIVYGSAGYSLACRPFLVGAGISKLTICYLNGEFRKDEGFNIFSWKNNSPICFKLRNNEKSSIDFYVENIKRDSLMDNIMITNKLFYIKKTVYDDLLKPSRLPKTVSKSLFLLGESENYYQFSSTDTAGVSSLDLEKFEGMFFADPLIFEYDLKFADSNKKPLMAEVLNEYLGESKDYWIPYSFKERQKKFPLAFQELGKYRSNGKMELS